MKLNLNRGRKIVLFDCILGIIIFVVLLAIGLRQLPLVVWAEEVANPDSCRLMNQAVGYILGGPCTPVLKIKPVGLIIDLVIFMGGGILAFFIINRVFKKRVNYSKSEQ